MKTPIYKTLILLIIPLVIYTQLTAQSQISVLTHGPGEELYSAFGHSAIRVQDSSKGIDHVYNFGVFDYNDPKFLSKFVQGKTDYYLEREDFSRYIQSYYREGRYTHEQRLNLDSTEISKCVSALEENAKEENKYYRYDFLKDNCSSRILDVLMASAPNLEVHGKLNEDNKSYRDIVDKVYQSQHKYWVSLGVRILFGDRANTIPTSKEMSFLPEQLEYLLYKSSVRGQPLVSSIQNLSPDNVEFAEMPFYQRPGFWFTLLAFVLFVLFMRSSKSLIVFDVVYVLLGLLGLLLLYLGLFTENPYFPYNWDLLWANPFFILIPFIKDRKKHWYKSILSYSLFAVLFFQFILRQPFPSEVIPLVFVLWLSMIRFKRFFKKEKRLEFWKR